MMGINIDFCQIPPHVKTFRASVTRKLDTFSFRICLTQILKSKSKKGDISIMVGSIGTIHLARYTKFSEKLTFLTP